MIPSRRRAWGLCLGLALSAHATLANERTRLSLEQTLPASSSSVAAQLQQGAAVFRQPWLIAPSASQPEFAGLGPLYNALSCSSCHLHNGRGEMPESGLPLHSALLRLSVLDHHGRTQAEPSYGSQLQTGAIPGVAAEGQLSVAWLDAATVEMDGQSIGLRRPEVRISQLGYGPLAPATVASLRMAPALTGVGLLQAVPVAAILAIARQQREAGAGIHGQPNWILRPDHQPPLLGRFGWKASIPSVLQQTAIALSEDLGVTSRLAPQPNCTPAERACAAAIHDGTSEISDRDLDALLAYQLQLAPPPVSSAPDTARGGALFRQIGCASCHQPDLPLPDPLASRVGSTRIHPYTDLLLHDMGPGLADGRPDQQASGRQWRTAPLWGLGLAALIRPQAFYLHDGRARTLPEAILWHDGEARRSVQNYRALDQRQRQALLSFVGAL